MKAHLCWIARNPEPLGVTPRLGNLTGTTGRCKPLGERKATRGNGQCIELVAPPGCLEVQLANKMHSLALGGGVGSGG